PDVIEILRGAGLSEGFTRLLEEMYPDDLVQRLIQTAWVIFNHLETVHQIEGLSSVSETQINDINGTGRDVTFVVVGPVQGHIFITLKGEYPEAERSMEDNRVSIH